MKNQVYLSLGGNMGDSVAYLKQALEQLDALDSCHLKACSPLYRTPAWGKTDQADFLNLACHVETTLDAQEFLALCQGIEKKLGRIRLEKWGQRTLDIDLIFWNQEIIKQANLQIPHVYMHERAFVLLPLAHIAPDVLHPILQKTVKELLEGVKEDCQAILEVQKSILEPSKT